LIQVFTVLGARPQFIKSWALSRALTSCGIQEFVAHTGQHYDDDMSEVFFRELGLRPPDVHLNVRSASHAQMTARMLEGLEPAMRDRKPRAVIVYGDTNSTLAGALAAAKLGIPVVHVEAGLRSFNRSMPEEVNRVVTDHVSDLLCCPTAAAVANLAREGFDHDVTSTSEPDVRQLPSPWIANVGDVMLDVLRHFREVAASRSTMLDRLALSPRQYVVATLHRAENTADAEQLASLLEEIAALARSIRVVFPMHPRTRAVLDGADAYERFASQPGVTAIEPVSYLDLLHLNANARGIVTDSGGLQKEALFLGVPCLTVRDETEWAETVEAGGNRLVGRRPSNLAGALEHMTTGSSAFVDKFGAGDAAGRIAGLIRALVRA